MRTWSNIVSVNPAVIDEPWMSVEIEEYFARFRSNVARDYGVRLRTTFTERRTPAAQGWVDIERIFEEELD